MLAALAALAGLSGRAGLAFFLLGLMLASSVGALVAVVSGALDSLRDRPVGRERVVAALVLGFGAVVLAVMVVGLGG